MSNKNPPRLNDMEYQIPEEEYVPMDAQVSVQQSSGESHDASAYTNASAGDDTSKAAKLKRLLATGLHFRNKKLPLIIGGAVVVCVGLTIYHAHHQPEVATAASTVTPVTQTVAMQNDAASQSMQLASMNQQAIADLGRSNSDNQQAILQVQQQLQGVAGSVAAVSDTQAQVNATLVALTEEVKALSQQVNAAQLKPVSAPQAPRPVLKPIVFHLKALTPGRAWIMDNQAHSTSVKVGDQLARYGVINRIDVDQGLVLTSSGLTIQYNDVDG